MDVAVKSKSMIEKPQTNKRWMIVAMITLGTAINYVDRVNFSVAAPLIMKEFDIQMGVMGILMSAFFWTYTIGSPLGGIMVAKYGARKTLGTAGVSWGFATMLVSVCSGFYSFLIARLLLGLSEGPVLPVNSHIVSIWNPVKERTFATSCFNCATKIGSAFAPFLIAYLIAVFGWRSSFVITGMIGTLWGVAYIWMYRDPGDHPTISASELAYIRQDEIVQKHEEKKKIKTLQYFTYRPVVQSGFAYFFMLYFFSVAAFWTPTYFVKSWGVSIKEMGILASIPWIVCFVSELIGGKFWDMLVRRGVPTNTVRRIGLGVTLFGPAIFCALIPTSTTPLQGALYVSLALGSFGFGNSNLFASIVDLAPAGEAGKVVGLVSVIGNIGGMVGPLVTGYVVQMGYGFNGAFTICSLTSIISGLLYVFNNYNKLVARN